jgi:hypothetical protein
MGQRLGSTFEAKTSGQCKNEFKEQDTHIRRTEETGGAGPAGSNSSRRMPVLRFYPLKKHQMNF